jgi:hypothetical protein
MQRYHKFSPLDTILPPLYVALIYGFPCSPDGKDQVFSVLQGGISNAVRERPILSADILRDESEQARPGSLLLKIPESDPDIHIAQNDMSIPEKLWIHTYEELKAAEMPLSLLDGKVLAPMVSGIAPTTKVMSAQLNYIPGGCLLSVAFAHAFVDGIGVITILELWAKHCRKLQGVTSSNVGFEFADDELDIFPPSLEKDHISRTDFERLKQRPELWRLLCLDPILNLEPPVIRDSTAVFPTTIPAAPTFSEDDLRVCLFRFTPSTLSKLKKDASPAGPGWISTKDAMHALMWQSIMKARFPNGDSGTTILSIPINGRPYLRPEISRSYIGNVILFALTDMPIHTLTSEEMSLAKLSVIIRDSIRACQDPNILSNGVDLAAAIPDTRQLVIAVHDYSGLHLSTTSWMDFPFYDIEFGGILGEAGRPEFFRMPKDQFGAICSLQPRQKNGVVDIVIGMKGKDMERLLQDTCFSKYARFVCE